MKISTLTALSMFTHLQTIATRPLYTQRMSRTSLVYLWHTLEQLLIQHQTPATLLVGFQSKVNWEQERHRYQTLSAITESIWVFTDTPIWPIEAPNCHYVPLAPDHPLKDLWFLWIRSAQFSAVMCGIACQDTVSGRREFDTFWSFEPEILSAILDILLETTPSATLSSLSAQRDRLNALPFTLDPRLMTDFLQTVVQVEETLNRHLQTSLYQQRQIQQQLNESEMRFQKLAENSPDLIMVLDLPAQKWVYHNRLETFIPPTLIDRALLDYIPLLIHPEDQAQAWQYWHDLAQLQEGQTLTIECRATDSVNWYQLRSTLFKRDSNGRVELVIITVTEITQRKLIEEALRASEARFQRVIHAIDHHIYAFEVDRAGHLKYFYLSPNVTKLTGYAESIFIENPFFWVTETIVPEDQESANAQYQRLLQGESGQTEYRLKRKDGRIIWVEDNARCEIDPMSGARLVYGLIHDITAQKLIELQLRQQEKLQNALEHERELNQLKNNLMNTLSHELRTPLATILSVCDLLQQFGQQMSWEHQQRRLHLIRGQVEHLRGMLDDISIVIRNQSGRGMFHPFPTLVTPLIAEIIEEVRLASGTAHQWIVVHTKSEHEDRIPLDQRLFKHILTNLLINAIKYSPDHTEIRLETYFHAHQFELRVIDQGIGILESDQAQLFEPFFRGSNVGEINGTGLGLRIVQDYVHLHQGTIRCQSQLGQGTTFIVTIPY
ncbi:MAG: ATP-binding protein [Anaerolineae bacterium]|jgi:PAS domain S-box-containing protein|nr:ATP-binding protein [Anaerolineae bacterium]